MTLTKGLTRKERAWLSDEIRRTLNRSANQSPVVRRLMQESRVAELMGVDPLPPEYREQSPVTRILLETDEWRR